MNERIHQLADQADAYTKSEYEKWVPTLDFYKIPNQRKIFNEKFAELIVRECIQNIRDNMDNAKVDTDGDKELFLETLRTSGHFYITELKAHFGVEQ